MDRRNFLRSLAASGAVAGTTATAGCAGVLGESGPEGTILGPPEQTRGDPVHPIQGDEMPEFTVPDPITGEEISTAQFEGERAFLWTMFYTNCPDGVCPALILRLRRAQEVAAEEGFEDEAAFLPTTFDPERDTAEVLREYADQRGVDLDAGNWHFLRPETYERGQELFDEEFGLKIEKAFDNDYESLEYTFPHYGLILLVNKRGIVERAYPRGPATDVERIVDDFRRVVTA
ncbi:MULTISPECIES: SCO family protein [Halorubrum]|jgi:protein SCO1/2|uniref:Electron transporter SenC n=1 Tax=Halorubrum tropicale TaxID=1765655 RepID=A0A0N0BRK0_9EURY|nr:MULTISPECIES: SCO family protein [Halorubrum]KOX96846.1 electron transporter SenC [Halorubrum tropicale]TKX45321.1 SCO family protein [Halorubrum sp. ARQ200]TKX51505.1 SCO family protein [Halorubrum sp. ASP121]TKX61313.1 SCO family protein [Halorubrum sp. ASP1]